jgi:hypothetical protein
MNTHGPGADVAAVAPFEALMPCWVVVSEGERQMQTSETAAQQALFRMAERARCPSRRGDGAAVDAVWGQKRCVERQPPQTARLEGSMSACVWCGVSVCMQVCCVSE